MILSCIMWWGLGVVGYYSMGCFGPATHTHFPFFSEMIRQF
jgi:hypothetical protein